MLRAVGGPRNGRRHMPKPGASSTSTEFLAAPGDTCRSGARPRRRVASSSGRLAHGAQMTSDAATLAHHRAAQAVERAADAWRRRCTGMPKPSRPNLRAAAAHEQAAITAPDDECDIHTDRGGASP